MRWPWQRPVRADRLVLSWSGQRAVYLVARAAAAGAVQVRQAGVVAEQADGLGGVVRQLDALGLRGLDATIMLGVEQYQLLQIDTPNVPPEELRSAARYQVRDLLESHVDDVTIDVLQVGDGRQQGAGHSFVVAAPNAAIRRVVDLAGALDLNLAVIDIQETAQRNLQSALAQRDGVLDRANAALVLTPGRQAVLTISVNEELFYTRRFDVPPDFLTSPWGDVVVGHEVPDGFTPVQEYVPTHRDGDLTFDSGFADQSAVLGTAVAAGLAVPDADKAQRLVLEVQRSLDVWDRSWSNLPLNRFRVFAGERSAELARWLGVQLGQSVGVFDAAPLIGGLDALPPADLASCFPLFGVLLRPGESAA